METAGELTSPTDQHPLSTRDSQAGVVVIGAGYSGLIAGAILARNGVDVTVIDDADQVGGKGGAVDYGGYWIDLAHRDARGTGDTFLVSTKRGRYSLHAAERAGADVKFEGPFDPLMNVHFLPNPTKIISLMKGPQAMRVMTEEILGLSARDAKQYFATLDELATNDYLEYVPITFREWLPTIGNRDVQRALLRWARIVFSIPAQDSSVGRVIQALKNPQLTLLANDHEAGGMQGFMEPYARVIRAHGGSIRLGQRPIEITTGSDGVTGVVTLDRSSAVQTYSARHVVFAQPVWDVIELLFTSRLPEELVRNAEALKGFGGDLMLVAMGLRSLPAIRATGAVETKPTFNRILKGPDCIYGGGWWIPSTVSRRQAPNGKHLLEVAFGTAGPGCADHEPFATFAEGKAKVDYTVDYMREYYSNLDTIVEWSSYHLSKAPTVCEVWKPIRRAPLEAPGIRGLYFADSTTEVDGQEQDIAANAAMQVADLIMDRLPTIQKPTGSH